MKYVIEIEDSEIYPDVDIEAKCRERGMYYAEFRPPKQSETILSIFRASLWVCTEDYPQTHPRAIVKPLPPKPEVAPDGYELTGECRRLNETLDTWAGVDGKAHSHELCGYSAECGDCPDGAPRWILKKGG